MRVLRLENSHRFSGLRPLSSELPRTFSGRTINHLERLVSSNNVETSLPTAANRISQKNFKLSDREGANQTKLLKMSLRPKEDSQIGVKDFRRSLEDVFNKSPDSLPQTESLRKSLESSFEKSTASPESKKDWFSAIRAQRLAQKSEVPGESPPSIGDINMPSLTSADLPKWESFTNAEKLTQAFVRLQANPRLSAEVKTEMNNAVGEQLFKLAFAKTPENLPQVLTGYEQFASTNQGSTMLDFFSQCIKDGSVHSSFARAMAPSASTLSEPVRQLLSIYNNLSGRDLTNFIDGNHEAISFGTYADSGLGMKKLLSGKHDKLIEQASQDPLFAVYARSMPEFEALAARLVKEGKLDRSAVVDLQSEAKPVKYIAYSGKEENTVDQALWNKISNIPVSNGSIADIKDFVDLQNGTVLITDLKNSTPSSQIGMKAVQEASLAPLHIIRKYYGDKYIHQFNGDSITTLIPGTIGKECRDELAAWQAKTLNNGLDFRLGFVPLSEEMPLSVGRNENGTHTFAGLEKFDAQLKAMASETSNSGEVRTVDLNPTKKPDGIYLRVAPEVTKNGAKGVVNMMIPLRRSTAQEIEEITKIIHKIVGKEVSQVFGPGIRVGTPENPELRIRNFGREMEGSFKAMNDFKISYFENGMAILMPQLCATEEQVAELEVALEKHSAVIKAIAERSEHATVYSPDNGQTWETLQSTLFRTSPALKKALKEHHQEQQQQLKVKEEMDRRAILARRSGRPIEEVILEKLSNSQPAEPQKISVMQTNKFRRAWADGRRMIQEGVTSQVASSLGKLIAAQNASPLIRGLTSTKQQSILSSNTA